MTTELMMPALSPTREKGSLAKWLVAEGDSIKAGDRLAEIESDKIVMEFEAAIDGRIATLLIAKGTGDVLVGTASAILLHEGESLPLSVFTLAPSDPGIPVHAPLARGMPPGDAPAIVSQVQRG